MDYQRWNLAANITTMAMTIIGLFTAITYYFSLIHLELRYYLYAYLSLVVIASFIFFYVFFEPKEVRP